MFINNYYNYKISPYYICPKVYVGPWAWSENTNGPKRNK